MERINLTPGYNISRIIKGGWHLAGGHGQIDETEAINDMVQFVEAGITTFDCADIYTGVEEKIGKFLKSHKDAFTSGSLPSIQIHTKYVPDYGALATLTKEDTESIIDRSLKRLGVEQLDLVQFAWWDYQYPRYVDTALHLQNIQKKGKIRHLGATNFDGQRLKEMMDVGVKFLSHQVQYSVLDHRVEGDLIQLQLDNEISTLCYGVIAGGFLSDRYLGKPSPTPPMENRSLTKYRLIIDEYGGWDQFQFALNILSEIAQKHNVGIAEIASRYILEKQNVAGIIVGARNTRHIDKLLKVSSIKLDHDDRKELQKLKQDSKGPSGPFYALERIKDGPHGRIMKYNLNES
ncbi:MAG: aldo/keto reductase [Saprospiraceae bacterium]|nr:aldo/keto reductase [Saprospiraceae bacterium]